MYFPKLHIVKKYLVITHGIKQVNNLIHGNGEYQWNWASGYSEVLKNNANLHSASKNTECFYFSLLLHTIRGPMCFKDLKTVNGYICKTYRDACQLLGLL